MFRRLNASGARTSARVRRDGVPSVVKLSPLDDEVGGAVEFVFWKMTKNAGIRVPQA